MRDLCSGRLDSGVHSIPKSERCAQIAAEVYRLWEVASGHGFDDSSLCIRGGRVGVVGELIEVGLDTYPERTVVWQKEWQPGYTSVVSWKYGRRDVLHDQARKVGASITASCQEHVCAGRFDKISQCLADKVYNRSVAEEMLAQGTSEANGLVLECA